MPDWDAHYSYAKAQGVDIDAKSARQLEKAIDSPVFAGRRLAHKAIHNDLGIRLARLAWGELGENYVKAHLQLDRTPIFKLRIPPIPPKKTVTAQENPENSSGTLFADLFRMFLLLTTFKYFLPG